MPSFSNLTLRTDRLLLRPLCEADAPSLFAIFSDPRVMRYWSTPAWPTIDKAHALIAQDMREIRSRYGPDLCEIAPNKPAAIPVLHDRFDA